MVSVLMFSLKREMKCEVYDVVSLLRLFLPLGFPENDTFGVDKRPSENRIRIH